ncbi:hypothetical protein LOK49_LG10G00221 [Camellia lanceoleosa]|uniref:Uncharacterized protein n=1 Tax=Camellia lanceoleosa TaxID=1840588 RepID=A0ACC0GEY2_9ERIC|nr:hypothetical protein LOK49_LG10G00221 [Camellia lanceoleosa]
MLLRKLQHCSRNKMQRVMTCLNQMLWKRHPEKAHILHEFQLGHGLSVHSSAAPQEERRRSKAVDDCLVSGRRIADGKSHGIDHLKTSGVSGPKARPPIVPSSFSLRCEERAAKRKGASPDPFTPYISAVLLIYCFADVFSLYFYHLLFQFFQKLEEKTNAKEADKVHLQAKNKISLTQPLSPKLGRKTIPGMVQDTGSRPPRRPSVKILPSSKDVTEKST